VPPKVLLPKPGLTRVCFTQALIAALAAFSVGHSASGKSTSSISTSSISKSTVRVYEKSDQDFLNPERGLFSPQEGVAVEGLKEIRRLHQVSVIRTYFALDAYRNAPLPADYLDKLDAYFEAVREAGLKAIVRFAYSSSMDQPDAPLERILSHGDQLQPILKAHADIILMLEAGFIGAWGEWHSSKSGLDTDQGRKTVLLKLLSILPAERMVAVRCNFYKRAALGVEKPLGPSEAFSGSHHARVGAHNDCLGASQDDFGTYTANAIEAEKTFLNLDNRYVPQEGETCSPGNYARCANMVQDLKRMRWDLLNRGYHPAVLDGWKQEGCFNEVQKNLGYRFVLRQAEIQDSAKIGEGLRVSITLANEGWGKAFNPRGLELILRGVNGGTRYVLPLEYDPRRWGAGDSVRFEVTGGIPPGMLAGRYKVFLNLPDPMPRLRNRPEYSIRLANTGLWEDSTGMNDLMHTVTVYTNVGIGNHAGAFFMPLGAQGTVSIGARAKPFLRSTLIWRAGRDVRALDLRGRVIAVPRP
jgi:Domain of unknown function (DUF4832)/Domain of unknown function (DUF4874)